MNKKLPILLFLIACVPAGICLCGEKPKQPEQEVITGAEEAQQPLPEDNADNGTAEYPPMVLQETDEDIIAIIEDYVRKEIRLKRGFFMLNPESNQILKLKFDSINKKVGSDETGKRIVDAVFLDDRSKKYAVEFNLETSPWGGLDISAIILRKAAGKPVKYPETPEDKK